MGVRTIAILTRTTVYHPKSGNFSIEAVADWLEKKSTFAEIILYQDDNWQTLEIAAKPLRRLLDSLTPKDEEDPESADIIKMLREWVGALNGDVAVLTLEQC